MCGSVLRIDSRPGAIEHVFEGRVGRVLMTGRKTGAIYYTQGDAIFALDPVTKQSRQLAKLPRAAWS